jgi:hypothetical protein
VRESKREGVLRVVCMLVMVGVVGWLGWG